MSLQKDVIAIIDVGKTNKKVFLLDRDYRFISEQTSTFEEISDEDGDACEDLMALKTFVSESIARIQKDAGAHLKAINFSAYGASFVNIDKQGRPVTPLYNYLKPYPAEIQQDFYNKYGGEKSFARETASPVLGSLNSGMQLYRLKRLMPETFGKISCALHLPQYLSSLITGQYFSDMTSLGSHTNLWNFDTNEYHEWVSKEGVGKKLAPIVSSDHAVKLESKKGAFVCGIGLHDSSAALIPYLLQSTEPFTLISTGTWSISLNPFNTQPLTSEELAADCLSYLSYDGKPVKASRLFAGHFHEAGVRRISAHFDKSANFYKSVNFDKTIIPLLRDELGKTISEKDQTYNSEEFAFTRRELPAFKNSEDAYSRLITDIVIQQFHSTRRIVDQQPNQTIYVDGGFSENPIFMHLLAAVFPGKKVFGAKVPQATALGAALAIHHSWNAVNTPAKLIQLTHYPVIEP